MLGIGIGEVIVVCVENLLRRNFTVPSGNRDNLVTASLYSTCFVDVDMSRGYAKRRLMGTENRGNYDEVCLCTAHKEVYVGIGSAAFLPYITARSVAELVGAVAGCLGKVCFYEGVDDFGKSAFAVVVVEANHS